MSRSLFDKRSFFALALLLAPVAPSLTARSVSSYFPPRGKWERKQPAAAGMDAAKLKQAVEYAQANGSDWDFARDQARTFGAPLGPLPKQRSATNGIILRHGYVVAEFGDTKTNDPVYSVAKSFLSTVCSVAVAKGLIKDVNDPVAKYIHDGGYDSAHNAKVTWKHHLQQTSEWEGALWGKNADFVGADAFGRGERKPRAIQEPGSFYEYNDVRINRFSLSLLRLFGKGLPEVLKTEIMDPIGASADWRWVPYNNSTVETGGRKVASVSGGTRWGGGLWINSEDLARFGLMILNDGKWDGRPVVSSEWLKDAVAPGAHGPDYGYLWWLNTKKEHWPSAPTSSFAALGNGSNTIWIDPEHDIVFVWHWHKGEAMDGMIQRILAAATGE
ncbi:MAG: class C beta-lactamase-related serine hydrolase [Bryobacterales bacterium]|nr:class C beta-lactamase-related serine hydrolase [Bryobacterales bacterium]